MEIHVIRNMNDKKCLQVHLGWGTESYQYTYGKGSPGESQDVPPFLRLYKKIEK